MKDTRVFVCEGNLKDGVFIGPFDSKQKANAYTMDNFSKKSKTLPFNEVMDALRSDIFRFIKEKAK